MALSRNEDILQAIVDGTSSSELPSPKSREERLLHAILDKLNAGGGGSGSTGLSIHICSANEYNLLTGVPTVQNPSETTFYLVPTGDGTNDIYDEWVYVDGAWEHFGSGSHSVGTLSDMSDVQIANVQNGQALIYNSQSNKWVNGDAGNGETYSFSEGEVDGAFLVEDSKGRQQSVMVHGLLPFCFADSDEELIFDSESIDDDD